MRKSGIKPISTKQKEKNAHWKKVTDERVEEGAYICQWCGKRGQRDSSMALFSYLDGHHIVRRSRGRIDTKDNCYIVHRICHQYIHDHNIDVGGLTE